MQTPNLVRVTPTFSNIVAARLGLVPTQDDQYLLELNSAFSSNFDRTGMMNVPRVAGLDLRFKFAQRREPVLWSASADLDTLCHARAQQILAQNRSVCVFWSGGIDSTVALTYLLLNKQHADQITVYHTCESLAEFPSYEKFIRDHGVKLVSWSDAWSTPFSADHLVVTGQSNDQLTASMDQSFYNQHNDWLHRPWRDFFSVLGLSASMIDRSEQVFSTCPVPIQTVLHARWWFYFYIRHSYWVTSDYNNNLENLGTTVCFYNTQEFDNWSMHNRHSLIGNTYQSYKQVFKDAIYQHWPDADYRDNKTKTNSAMGEFWARRKMIKFDQHYLLLYQDQAGSIRAFRPQNYPFLNIEQIKTELEQLR